MFFFIYFAALLTVSYNGVNAIPINNDVSESVCKEPNSYLPVEGSCDFYIICKDNKKSNEICPDGLTFDPAVKYPKNPCIFPTTNNNCQGRVSQEAKPTAECPHQYGFFPAASGDVKDCAQYRICAKGRATVKSCPNGLIFNPANSHCDYRSKVPSCQEKKPESDNSTGGTPSSKNETTSLPEKKPENITDPATANNSTDVTPTEPEKNKPSDDTTSPTKDIPPTKDTTSPAKDIPQTKDTTSPEKDIPPTKDTTSPAKDIPPTNDTTSPAKDDEKTVVPPRTNCTEDAKPTAAPGPLPVTAVITIGSINMNDVNMKIPLKKK